MLLWQWLFTMSVVQSTCVGLIFDVRSPQQLAAGGLFRSAEQDSVVGGQKCTQGSN